MTKQLLKGVALALVLAYSGMAAAKPRAPNPDLGLMSGLQGNQALVAIHEESRVAMVKPKRVNASEHAALEASTNGYPAAGGSAAATERCAE